MVGFQVPDVDGTALVTHNELCLRRHRGGEAGKHPALQSPRVPSPRRPPHLVGVQAHTVNGRVHLEDSLTLQVPGPLRWGDTPRLWCVAVGTPSFLRDPLPGHLTSVCDGSCLTGKTWGAWTSPGQPEVNE